MQTPTKSKLYTASQFARLFGLQVSTTKSYVTDKTITAVTNEKGDYLKENGEYLFTQETVDAYAEHRRQKGLPIPATTVMKEEGDQQLVTITVPSSTKTTAVARSTTPITTTIVEVAPAPRSSAILVQVENFLAANGLGADVHSFQKEDISRLHLWNVQTPELPLRVIATSEGEVTVLCDQYQRQLEDTIAGLNQELREAKRKLEILRKKPQTRIIDDYAQPLELCIETDEDGIIVIWSNCLPFSGLGRDEEEALASFRRVLWGYTYWLRTHENKLTEELHAQYQLLRSLLVEVEGRD